MSQQSARAQQESGKVGAMSVDESSTPVGWKRAFIITAATGVVLIVGLILVIVGLAVRGNGSSTLVSGNQKIASATFSNLYTGPPQACVITQLEKQRDYEFIIPTTGDLPSQTALIVNPLAVSDIVYCLPPNQEMSPDANEPENVAAMYIRITVNKTASAESLPCSGQGDSVLRLTRPYSQFWNANWRKTPHSADLICSDKQINTNTVVFTFIPSQPETGLAAFIAPNKPGLYNMRYEWVKRSTGQPISKTLFRFTLDVTCDLETRNEFCEGVRRYITDMCVNTIKPCGLDLLPCNPHENPSCNLSAVSASNLCNAYACNNAERRCSIHPVAVIRNAITNPNIDINTVPGATPSACIGCLPPPCKPDCSKGKKCGSDGCGGSCGTCSGLKSQCTSSGLCIEPAGPSTTPGTCNNPFNLFDVAGTSLVAGFNITAYERATQADGEYIVQPIGDQMAFFNSKASDKVTVPTTGVLLKVTYANTPTYASDQTGTTCSSTGGVPDVIYRFKLDVATGFEAYILDISGNPTLSDNLLSLHGGDGTDNVVGPTTQCEVQYSADNSAANVPCADDSSPPGGYGSRIFFAKLQPGVYYIIATSYAAQAAGSYQLWAKFTDTTPSTYGGAAPKCNEKLCGDDEVGFVCNPSNQCTSPEKCRAGHCSNCPDAYVPNCQGIQCGPPMDGCTSENLCGECKNSQRQCNLNTGQCVTDFPCDPLVPTCNGDTNYGNKGDFWCGNDCAWHKGDELLFDLIPNREAEILPSLTFDRRTFSPLSCVFQESCISAPGSRLLLRQTTSVHNQGMASFMPGDVTREVNNFVYSSCHQHFHFLDFASFALRAPVAISAPTVAANEIVVGGGKLSYCMEDTRQYMTGPRVPCVGSGTCSEQKIQVGWTDEYNANLDCQWFDTTAKVDASFTLAQEIQMGCIVENAGVYSLPATVPLACQSPMVYVNRWYFNEVAVNVAHRIPEYSFKNNRYAHLVFFPYVPSIVEAAQYASFFNKNSNLYRNPCAQLPAGFTSLLCTDIDNPNSPAYKAANGLPFTL